MVGPNYWCNGPLGFYLRSWSHWYGTRFRITRTLGSRATCNGAIRPSDLRTLGQPSGFRTFRSSDLRTSDLRISIPRSWDPPTPTHTADHTTFSNATHPHTQHPAEGPKVRGKGCTAINANQRKTCPKINFTFSKLISFSKIRRSRRI